MATIDVPVATEADDVTTRSDGIFISGCCTVFAGRSSTINFNCAMRFALAINQGETINAADLDCVGFGAGGTGTRLRFNAEAVDNATQIVSVADYNSRPVGAAFVDIDPFPALTFNVICPFIIDIASVIQEVIMRPGWVSGNNLNLFLRENGSDSGKFAQMLSQSFSPTSPASLHVDFGAAVGGGGGAFSPAAQQSYSQLII